MSEPKSSPSSTSSTILRVSSPSEYISYSSSMGSSQFVTMGFELKKRGKVVKAEELMTKMKGIQEKAQAALKKAQVS